MKDVSIKDFLPLPETDDQFSLDFIKENKVLLLLSEGERRIVGAQSKNDALFKRIEKHFNTSVEFVTVDPLDLTSYINRKISNEVDDIGDNQSLRDTAVKNDLASAAKDTPVINFVNNIILEAIHRRVSDIHLECRNENAEVRFRVDGYLIHFQKIPDGITPSVSARIKIMSDLNVMENRRAQEGRISVVLEGRKHDLRVSIVPISDGESIVLRLFNREDQQYALEELGFPKSAIHALKEMGTSRHGLIISCGPTGSGKTTTLNALLRYIQDDRLKIITIEDPVEYKIPKVDQIPVREDLGLGFDIILSKVLRQDPDIIMVGEIRDSETARLAIRAALTGHLVFASLHTNSADEVIPRLLNLDVPKYLIDAVLIGAFTQRLVRLTCTHCGSPHDILNEERILLKKMDINVPSIVKGDGCEYCNNLGYSGRTGIIEGYSIVPNPETGQRERHFFSRFSDQFIELLKSGKVDLSEVISYWGQSDASI